MYRVRTVFSGLQGAPWLSTMFFNTAAGTSQQAATAVGTFWGAADAAMDSEVDWRTEAEVAILQDSTGQLLGVESTTPATGTGALATESLPRASQGLIRWRTGAIVNGRELRGRTFVPALVEAANDNGAVAAATQTILNNAATALIADANTQLVVWHRPDASGSTSGVAHEVISGTTWVEFAVLRSRRD